MGACLFPFDRPATIVAWLVLAIAAGWLYGGHVAAQVGTDAERYRTRCGGTGRRRR